MEKMTLKEEEVNALELKRHIQLKQGERMLSGNPGDWIVFHESGRVDILTDEEFPGS